MRIVKFTAIILLSVLILVCSQTLWADRYDDFRPYEVFDKASKDYSESNFDAAVKGYEDIIGHGHVNSALLYNLGNAYFKTGALGKAILNYERAKKLSPYDSDLKANLEYALSVREEPAMEQSRVQINRKIDNFLGLFTIKGLWIALNIIYLTVLGLLILLLFNKNLKRAILNSVTILSIIFLLVLTLMSVNIYRTEHIVSAIVVAKAADARYEPLAGVAVRFRLYEGSRISVIKIKGGWSQIRREDGKIGWIETDLYEVI